jgi:hypothetical protein
MSITAVSAATRLSADLFAASSAHSGATLGKATTVAIDDCGTVVPHKIPGSPPPPPPFTNTLTHFAGVDLAAPTMEDGGWCGTVPHKLPSLPPPPAPSPWLDGVNQFLSSR